jgi:putative oxidoreductase
MLTVSGLVIVMVRYGLVVLFFPASALDKILNFQGAVKQASGVFARRPVAVLAILIGLLVELVMPVGLLTGVADRFAAFILAGYCVMTALLFKRFWEPGDFWARGDSKGRDLFWDFLKNLSLGSGFLLITVGVDGQSWAAFLAHPFASTQPYAGAAALH